MKLMVIIASTRPGRVGLTVGNWFIDLAEKDKRLEVVTADLAKINLPFIDEPNHPKMLEYTKEHTKKWSKQVSAADAFVIVTPEYNFSAPATIINALDYLYNEWNYKAVGFVSYGALPAGTRAVAQIKQLATTLKMVPMYEAVSIPFVQGFIDSNQVFTPNELIIDSAKVMIDELLRWYGALKTLRK